MDSKLDGENIINKINKYKLFFKNEKINKIVKNNVEKAKCELSNTTRTTIYIDCLYDNIDYIFELSRMKFDNLCKNEFNRCEIPIENSLRDAKLKYNDIDKIVLVGGSSRIPYIKNMLKNKFSNSVIYDNINPDEAVARGACIESANIFMNKYELNNNLNIVLCDVIPYSLGIEIDNGIMKKIINKNTQIPCIYEEIFTTHSDNQPNILIKIYEGENRDVSKNNLLGEFEISELPLMSRGVLKIYVKFSINGNGILNISVKYNDIIIDKLLRFG